jgi:hypothetical protein
MFTKMNLAALAHRPGAQPPLDQPAERAEVRRASAGARKLEAAPQAAKERAVRHLKQVLKG